MCDKIILIQDPLTRFFRAFNPITQSSLANGTGSGVISWPKCGIDHMIANEQRLKAVTKFVSGGLSFQDNATAMS